MLQNATYLNHSGNRVREAWLNSSRVWSIPFNTFWTYPSNTTTISNLNIITTQGDILVNWGDGTSSQAINSNINTNRTFTQPTTSISIAPFNKTFVTNINCGTSSPRLSGTIDISSFSNIEDFRCNFNDITAINGYADKNFLRLIQFAGNRLTGSIPSLSANIALQSFNCRSNQITGSIPSLNTNTQLIDFSCYSNQFTGSIPSLSANTQLTTFLCHINQLTGFEGGSVSNTLGNFQAQNNQLTQTTVNTILSTFDATTRTTGTRTLNLGGTGNSAPSYTGGVTTTSTGSNFTTLGTTVTAAVTNHNHPDGSLVTITGLQTVFTGTFAISSINANQFRYTVATDSPTLVTGSGTATMRRTTNANDGFRFYQNLALFGRLATVQSGLSGFPWTVTVNLP